jgi:hypothetical protein
MLDDVARGLLPTMGLLGALGAGNADVDGFVVVNDWDPNACVLKTR